MRQSLISVNRFFDGMKTICLLPSKVFAKDLAYIMEQKYGLMVMALGWRSGGHGFKTTEDSPCNL